MTTSTDFSRITTPYILSIFDDGDGPSPSFYSPDSTNYGTGALSIDKDHRFSDNDRLVHEGGETFDFSEIDEDETGLFFIAYQPYYEVHAVYASREEMIEQLPKWLATYDADQMTLGALKTISELTGIPITAFG